ncbi:anti-sigma-K factor RskA [Rhodobacter aestuarii]|uniref:Anti-sigma-K factor RskA n=1 Tax=Rhodobacter aestuarii TaxID=453582 RepID=A0A1N7N9E7_9RHOB|nr:anti-sigma factor [Rhodobacter aestuarii]PTV96308.1 anti-sigma-K factor RskA [Rhodobacter aestuarii]SIS94811.1 Anti-sigma-K factor RskA [Rhodobacter aestuarii]
MRDLPPDDIALAGEYVLGTLPLSERQAVTRRIASDADFAREVARWEAHLDPLAEEVMPVSPPRRVWAEIEARALGVPERAPSGLWRWLAGASAISAAFLGAILWLGEPLMPAQGRMWVSDMVSEDGAVRLAALYNEKTGEMRVSMGGAAPAPERDFELWLIAGDAAPVSLGVMPRRGQAAMPIPADLRQVIANATLAITEEPRGGAPAGVATGPLVAKAELRRI